MNDTTATPALRPDQRAQLDRARELLAEPRWPSGLARSSGTWPSCCAWPRTSRAGSRGQDSAPSSGAGGGALACFRPSRAGPSSCAGRACRCARSPSSSWSISAPSSVTYSAGKPQKSISCCGIQVRHTSRKGDVCRSRMPQTRRTGGCSEEDSWLVRRRGVAPREADRQRGQTGPPPRAGVRAGDTDVFGTPRGPPPTRAGARLRIASAMALTHSAPAHARAGATSYSATAVSAQRDGTWRRCHMSHQVPADSMRRSMMPG